MNNDQLSGERNTDKSDGGAEEEVENIDFDETVVMDTDVDPMVGTAEIKVDELVAKIDAATDVDADRERKIKRRLERLAEKRDLDLNSTYNINVDDESE